MADPHAAHRASYLGMTLQIDASDVANQAFFRHCAHGEFHLQCCAECTLLCYPPCNACPWCGHTKQHFTAVPATGTVYSYAEIHHPIQPAFADHLPYALLIVELDIQKDKPADGDAIRVAGNLADANGNLLSGPDIERVGIGSRVSMVFKSVGADIALPMWTLDKPAAPCWRYPDS